MMLFAHLFDGMPSEWNLVPFPDAVDFQEGPGILAKDFRSQGIPLLRLASLGRATTSFDGCNYLDPQMVERRWSHFRVAAGDILLTTSANLGSVCVVGREQEGSICYTGIIRMRPNRSDVLSTFMQYFLQSSAFQQQVHAVGSGSVLKHFGPTHLRQMSFAVPPVAVQRRIVELLQPLDDKIDLNRQTNRTLEAMAQALFRSWFVDFDPVVAKAEGRAPFGMDADTAALFPDRLVDSELGPIPEGWEAEEMDDWFTIGRETLAPASFPDEIFLHHSIPAFDAGREPVHEPGKAIKSNKFIVDDDCVLLSKLNPAIPRVWLPLTSEGHRSIASTEFLPCRPRGGRPRAFVYCLLNDADFRAELASMATGTSNSHQRARAGDIRRIRRSSPSTAIVERFGEIVAPWLARRQHLIRQNQTLAQLRDLLLPRLLSGELSVNDSGPVRPRGARGG